MVDLDFRSKVWIIDVPHDTRSARYMINTQWSAWYRGSQRKNSLGRASVLVYGVQLCMLDTRWYHTMIHLCGWCVSLKSWCGTCMHIMNDYTNAELACTGGPMLRDILANSARFLRTGWPHFGYSLRSCTVVDTED